MYPFVLAIHNIIRWVVVIVGILVAVRAILGFSRRQEWTALDHRAGLIFSIAVDLQLLIGLFLYFFLSPLTRTALQDFGAAMKIGDLRFFAVEHAAAMLLAFICVHLASVFVKRAPNALLKHQRAAVWYTLALLIILVGIPWMRPVFPGLG